MVCPAFFLQICFVPQNQVLVARRNWTAGRVTQQAPSEIDLALHDARQLVDFLVGSAGHCPQFCHVIVGFLQLVCVIVGDLHGLGVALETTKSMFSDGNNKNTAVPSSRYESDPS